MSAVAAFFILQFEYKATQAGLGNLFLFWMFYETLSRLSVIKQWSGCALIRIVGGYDIKLLNSTLRSWKYNDFLMSVPSICVTYLMYDGHVTTR